MRKPRSRATLELAAANPTPQKGTIRILASGSSILNEVSLNGINRVRISASNGEEYELVVEADSKGPTFYIRALYGRIKLMPNAANSVSVAYYDEARKSK